MTSLRSTSLTQLSYLTAKVSMQIPLLILFACVRLLFFAANRVAHSKISVSNSSYVSLNVSWMEIDSDVYDGWL